MVSRGIAVIVGSLRRESYTRKFARALIALAPPSLRMESVEIGDLPLYDADLDNGRPPPAWTAFRDRVRPLQGVLFATPEYNRSIPGVLKNAIDVGSRPRGASVWNAKPGAVIGVSPGRFGGFGASQHLRQVMVSLNMPAMAQPEAYIARADKLLDASGAVADAQTREFLQRFVQAFAAWVGLHAGR
jgi:chromate reductase, NAD(P)H dehydrogenase (quinone)